jgi:hypothetical protein
VLANSEWPTTGDHNNNRGRTSQIRFPMVRHVFGLPDGTYMWVRRDQQTAVVLVLLVRALHPVPFSNRIKLSNNLNTSCYDGLFICFGTAYIATFFMLVSCHAYSSTLKMEATCSSETSVDFHDLQGVISQGIELPIMLSKFRSCYSAVLK